MSVTAILYVSAVDSSTLTTGGAGKAAGRGSKCCEEPSLSDEKMPGTTNSLYMNLLIPSLNT